MLFLIIYGLSCLVAAVPIARYILKDFSGTYPDDQDRWAALILGLCFSWSWPGLLVVLGLKYGLTPGVRRFIRTDAEVRAAKDRELNALRAQAKALGLPYPEVKE